MKKLKQYDSLSVYRQSLTDPKAPFQVLLDGEVVRTFWSQSSCLYFEAAAVMFVNGQIAGHTDTYRSPGGIYLIVSDSRIKVDGNFRLYMEPTWMERDPKEPELRKLLDEAKARMDAKDAALVEFALLPDKEYWAKIKSEEYWLPPDGPGSAPHQAHNVTLYLSDKPFVGGKPQGEPTPLSNWTY